MARHDVKCKNSGECFTKRKILKMKRYANRVDLLTTLLQDEKEYTFGEIDSLLTGFMEKR